MDKTKYYNLSKPKLTDPADITEIAGNFDIIDEELKKGAFAALQTLYVDAAAAAGGDGTEAKPFKTIQEAVNAAYAGASIVKIKIKPGTYGENVSTPTASKSAWIFEKNGTGTVSLKSIQLDVTPYTRIDGLTFTPDTGTNAIRLISVASASIGSNTINGNSTGYGIYMVRSRARISGNSINGAAIAVFATENAHCTSASTSGTGNAVAFQADGSIIQMNGNTITATTLYKTINGGIIVSGDSNGNLKIESPIVISGTNGLTLAQGGMLFANAGMSVTQNANSFYLMYDNAWGTGGAGLALQRKTSTTQPGHFGLVASDGTQLQELRGTPDGTLSWGGNFLLPSGKIHLSATDAQIKAASEGSGDKGLDIMLGSWWGQGGACFALKHKDSTTQPGNFVLTASTGTKSAELRGNPDGGLQWNGKYIVRSVNGYTANFAGEVTIPVATSEAYGLVRVAEDDDVLNDDNDEAAITPAIFHDVSDFRHKETTYALGDKVECMFNFELFLECTQAGTTSSEPLDTRNVTHGQVITDGTAQWTVRTHIKSVGGVVADASGNVPIDANSLTMTVITDATVDDVKNLGEDNKVKFVNGNDAGESDIWNLMHIGAENRQDQIVFKNNSIFYRTADENGFTEWEEIAKVNQITTLKVW